MHSALRLLAMTSLAFSGLTGVVVQTRAENTPGTQEKSANPSDARWGPVSVQFPVSTRQFPAGEGAVIANAECQICHSAGMVLTQPARTEEQWKETINKMRTAYGAPLPAEQVDPLAAYLSRLAPEGKAGRPAD